MGRRLYVGNLPYTTGEAELQELFSKAGTVESVRVMRDAATGRARGFAFVEMATDEEAQKAATELNQFQMGGRALTVNEARPSPKAASAAAAAASAATAAAAAAAADAASRAGNADEKLVERRSRRAAHLRGGTLVEVNEHHTVIDFDEHGRKCVRDAARRAAGDQRAGAAQDADPQARGQEEESRSVRSQKRDTSEVQERFEVLTFDFSTSNF